MEWDETRLLVGYFRIVQVIRRDKKNVDWDDFILLQDGAVGKIGVICSENGEFWRRIGETEMKQVDWIEFLND